MIGNVRVRSFTVDDLINDLKIEGRNADAELIQGLLKDLGSASDDYNKLKRELAEARKAAVPWRDGPARDGEMPPNHCFVVCMGTNGGRTLYRFCGFMEHGQIKIGGTIFHADGIDQWFSLDDLLPPATTNAPEGERGE